MPSETPAVPGSALSPGTLSLSASRRMRSALEREAAGAASLLRSLGADIDTIAAARQDSSTDDEHDPEGSTLAFERSQAQALQADSVVRLAEVASALQRLAEGRYGMCERCGLPISPGRLEARPWAARCVVCAAVPR